MGHQVDNLELVKTAEAKVISNEKVLWIDDTLESIAYCESRNRQFNPDGTVLRGIVNPKDVGKFQINEYWHLDTAKRMGIDIYTLEGNTEYAKYLYSKNGTRDWNASKPCWSKLISTRDS